MIEENEYISKTQKKKEAEALQKLGEELANLPASQLKHLELPQDLYKALVDAKTITSNVAARRHRQFIGALMRDVDPEPIRLALATFKADPSQVVQPKTNKETEAWLNKLLTGSHDAIEEFLSLNPQTDRQHLRQLIRNANKDRAKKKKASKSLNALTKIVTQYLKDN